MHEIYRCSKCQEKNNAEGIGAGHKKQIFFAAAGVMYSKRRRDFQETASGRFFHFSDGPGVSGNCGERRYPGGFLCRRTGCQKNGKKSYGCTGDQTDPTDTEYRHAGKIGGTEIA